MALYLLFESAPAYALFHAHGIDQIGQNTEAVRSSVDDLNRFGKVVQLTAFHPFESALDGLTQINAVSEGIMTDKLRNFLELNLPKVKEGKKPKFSLGVSEPKVGSHISEETKIPCQCNDFIHELLRGVRMHFDRFIRDLKAGDTEKAQLGLGHSYSRAKVKFNVNRVDNMVIQAIFVLDTVDKDINSFSMRIREWYSWHFPELVKIINDNYQYAKVAKFVQNKSDLSEGNAPGLTDILGDEDKAREIIEASKSSMGQDISPIDLINVHRFAEKVINLSQYRSRLYDYLVTKMNVISPNLASLIGEVIGARLISHAGSLANLAKCPASTLQILGAEKALFRALKTHGSTPKYGLIFNSSFIGKASSKNKGRMARFLSNKCSIASRIDCYTDCPTATFGERLRDQVEERLEFYDKGVAPRKNIDVMKAAMEVVHNQNREMDESENKSKVTNRDASEPMEEDEPAAMTNGDAKSEKNKNKKEKRERELEAEREQDAVTNAATKSEKKDKRKLEQELDAEQDRVTASNASSKETTNNKKKKCEEGNGDHLQATGEVKKKKKSPKVKVSRLNEQSKRKLGPFGCSI